MSYRTWFLITYAMDTPTQNLKIVLRPTCAPFWKLIRVSKCAKSNNLSFRVKKIRLRHDPPTQSWKPPKQSDFTKNQFKLVPWCERKRMPKSFFITLLSDFRFLLSNRHGVFCVFGNVFLFKKILLKTKFVVDHKTWTNQLSVSFVSICLYFWVHFNTSF